MKFEDKVVLHGEMIAMNDLLDTVTIELNGVKEPLKHRVVISKQDYINNQKSQTEKSD